MGGNLGFKGRQFTAAVILWAVRWYLRWPISYRDLERMALDRGGQCRGMLYQLPEATLADELDRLAHREVSMLPSAFPWRWVNARTDQGPLVVLTFAVNRKSGRYIEDHSDEQLAEGLANACGLRGPARPCRAGAGQ